jgi:hypothetical protein
MADHVFDTTKRFFHMEDNGDGTMTCTMNLGKVEVDGETDELNMVQFVVKTDFDEMIGEYVGEEMEEYLTRTIDGAMFVPKTPEDITGEGGS